MNIKSLNFPNINKLAFKGIENKKSVSNSITAKPDSFIKTEEVETAKKEYSLADVQKLFHSVLLDTLKINNSINPVLNGVKMEIPKVKIFTNPYSSGIASYNFPTNTITVSEKLLNEDLFLCYTENKEKNQTISLGILTGDKLQEEIENCKKLGIDAKSLKLNDKEKEFFLVTSLAHETRHFFQSHLMASAEGISDKYKKEQLDAADELNKAVSGFNAVIENRQKAADEAKFYGEPIPFKMKQMLETYKPLNYMDVTYGKTYQPSQFLAPNTMFKFSVFPDNKKAMTIEHLYEATQRKAIKQTDNEQQDYLSNLTEIDAFNYGFEYSLAARKKFSQGTRKIVLDAISFDSQRSSNIGIAYAKQRNILPNTME